MHENEHVNYDTLYDSGMKCPNNVSWKPGVKRFVLNRAEEILKMSDDVLNGTLKHGKPKPIKITYPKPREGLSIPINDRVYQRAINDEALYPMITKSFIFDNSACQQGKGPDFARRRIKQFLWNYYCKYGNEGWILQIDISGYYPNMSHEAVRRKFKRHVPSSIYKMAIDVLDHQYEGEIGYNPGSQMVQIAGIALLDDIDHYIKEQLHEKYFIRYMDDFWICNNSREKLEQDLELLLPKFEEIGCTISEKKTHIIPLEEGFEFLGFDYRMTDTGKVLMFLKSENVKHEKQKLSKMVRKVEQGEMSKNTLIASHSGWENHASHGNSYKMIQRTRDYLNDKLGKEISNG